MEDCTFEEGRIVESKLNPYLKTLIQDVAMYSKKEARNDMGFLLSLYKLYSIGTGDPMYPEFKSYSQYGEKIHFFELCQKYFGYCRKYVERCINIVRRFIEWDVDVPIEKAVYKFPIFANYTISKLIELLPVSAEELQEAIDSGKIKPNSTQAELRSWVQSRKVDTPKVDGNQPEEKEQSEISGAKEKSKFRYDITRWYEVSELKTLGKKDLIEIIRQLQTKYVPYRSL